MLYFWSTCAKLPFSLCSAIFVDTQSGVVESNWRQWESKIDEGGTKAGGGLCRSMSVKLEIKKVWRMCGAYVLCRTGGI